MGSVQRKPGQTPAPEEEKRRRKRVLLQKSVERAREQLATDKKNGAKNEAYVKALIRYNEFLMAEKVQVQLHQMQKQETKSAKASG
jgi:hypothetical protein